jgi:hypothetical protein
MPGLGEWLNSGENSRRAGTDAEFSGTGEIRHRVDVIAGPRRGSKRGRAAIAVPGGGV